MKDLKAISLGVGGGKRVSLKKAVFVCPKPFRSKWRFLI